MCCCWCWRRAALDTAPRHISYTMRKTQQPFSRETYSALMKVMEMKVCIFWTKGPGAYREPCESCVKCRFMEEEKQKQLKWICRLLLWAVLLRDRGFCVSFKDQRRRNETNQSRAETTGFKRAVLQSPENLKTETLLRFTLTNVCSWEDKTELTLPFIV